MLHLGCGRKRDLSGYPITLPADVDLVNLDADPSLEPDVVCRLGEQPIPLPSDSIDLAVAWHVLEHIGTQGETARWFAFWEDLYRVLTPNGALVFESPYYTSIWAWSDPTHSRVISEHSFVFFNQDAYRIPGSAISPYRVRCDFHYGVSPSMPKGWALVADADNEGSSMIRGCVVARKPFRGWWE